MREQEFFDNLRDIGFRGEETLEGVLAFFRASGVDPVVLVECCIERRMPLLDEAGRKAYSQLLGARLTAQRTARGLSREDLSRATGYSTHIIRTAESDFDLGREEHVELARVLEVSTFDRDILEEVYR